MHPAPPQVLHPIEVIRLLRGHLKVWLLPTVVVGLIAAVYAVLRPATWEASQALVIRNEAINNPVGAGKFGHTDEMKTVQETILELTKSQGVLSAALKAVGAPAGRRDEVAWPSARDIDEARHCIKLTPPKGAEFGKTEVFYLQVQDCDRERSIALAQALCDQLEVGFQQFRNAKAQSMIDELGKTVEMAKADLADSTARLTRTEATVGSDLAELRALSEPSNGESAIRRTITEIRNELRQITTAKKTGEQLLSLLREAQQDPGRLVATPNSLLESQPGLRRLKEGLVDAQLKTAAFQGSMSNNHPRVIAARQAEEAVGRHLHDEMGIAIRGLEVELQVSSDRKAALEEQLNEASHRLDRLAGLRAIYANQVSETRNRSELAERAEQRLAEAVATHAAAKASSLISRIDTPDAGINPVGPSRAMIVLIGAVGGLLTGFGVLFLTVQTTEPVQDKPGSTNAATADDLPAMHRARIPSAQHIKNLSLKQALEKISWSSRT